MLSKNYHYIKISSLATFIALSSIATTGCNDHLAREEQCVAAANKDAKELKEATAGLLAPDIAETVIENNSCDSGVSGVYLTFSASRSISIDQFLRKSREQKWKAMDPSSEDCTACVAYISKPINGRSVHLSIADRSPSFDFEIEVLYR